MSHPPFPICRLSGRWREELPASRWRWLLLPAWCIYRPLVAVRGALYDLGIAPARQLPVPVVSVGNLTAGGTGKTPLVAHLVDWCRARVLSPAVLSRGYRGDGTGNDETGLIDGCPVVCDPDRIQGALTALAGGASCLILDDGFQHRRLHRDLDLVVIDATRPWGQPGKAAAALLPLGYLRESRRALRRAGVLAVSRTEAVPAEQLAALLASLAATGIPVVQLQEEDPHLRTLHGDQPSAVARLRDRPVLLISGIGNPEGFEDAARRHGWQVLASMRFPDHHRYRAPEVAKLAAETARRGAVAVVTRKDAAKLLPYWPAAIPAEVLHVRTAIRAEDRPALDAVLGRALGLPPLA